MSESYDAKLTFWPATPLATSVVDQLHRVGVNLRQPSGEDSSITLYRTSDGQTAVELAFDGCEHGLTGLEAVLATLRLARVNYVTWDTKRGEIAGVGRSFDRHDLVEQEFTVLAGGEPVLTAGDLDAFEHYGTAEALLHDVRRRLRLPLPEKAESLRPAEVTITIDDDEAPESDREAGAS
jgi:hypothetical protein